MIKRLFMLAALCMIAAVVFSPLAVFAQAASPLVPASETATATVGALLSALGASALTLSSIAGAAAWLAAVLPKATSPGAYGFIRAVLDAFGANFGNAKNAS